MDQKIKAQSSFHHITETINNATMSPLQIRAVIICVLINAIDGFDILAIAFTASEISDEWLLDPSSLGILFSAGLVGMAVGSFLLAPLADSFGRRTMILTSIIVISIGMLCSALALNVFQLAVLRFITGLGIGCVLPSLNAIVAEYTSNKRRSLAISIMTIGYSVGAVLGGVISIYLIALFGWRSVFWGGGLASLFIFLLAYFRLPESISFLFVSKSQSSLEKINYILMRMDHAPITEIDYKKHARLNEDNHIAKIFSSTLLRSTLLTCACFFLIMCSFYALLSWTPKLLIEFGMSTSGGISSSVLMNLSGIIGGMLLGWLSERYGLNFVSITYLVLCFIAALLISILPLNDAFLLGIAAVIGFLMNGTVVALYVLGPRSFPITVRATGIGVALGIGRLGGATGPYVIGLIMMTEVSIEVSFILMTIPMLAAAVIFSLITPDKHTDAEI